VSAFSSLPLSEQLLSLVSRLLRCLLSRLAVSASSQEPGEAVHVCPLSQVLALVGLHPLPQEQNCSGPCVVQWVFSALSTPAKHFPIVSCLYSYSVVKAVGGFFLLTRSVPRPDFFFLNFFFFFYVREAYVIPVPLCSGVSVSASSLLPSFPTLPPSSF